MARASDADIRRQYGLAPDAAVRHERPGRADSVRVRPDAFAVVELDSALEWAVWDRTVAVAGTTAHLTVQGTFVGEGSPTTVVLRDARNQTVGGGTEPMHRDRAIVPVVLSRQAASREPDGMLAAADVQLAELGLKVVSAPLLVLPFAELVEARWDRERAVEGDTVALSCRVDGTPAGVERLAREAAQITVLVQTESGATPLAEPVATFRATVDGSRIRAEWTVTLGLDRWDLIAQSTLDTQADQAGVPRGQAPYLYDRPHLVFQVGLAGLRVESAPLAVDDWVELSHTIGDEPAADGAYTLTLADGTERSGTLDGEGRAREEGLPPGLVTVTHTASPPPTPSEGAGKASIPRTA